MKRHDETIKVSDETTRLRERFEKLYVEKRVFAEDGLVQETPELSALLRNLYMSLGLDLKNHVGDKSKAEIEGDLLFNAKILVTRHTACVTYYGVYDLESGECRYLGARVHNNCV